MGKFLYNLRVGKVLLITYEIHPEAVKEKMNTSDSLKNPNCFMVGFCPQNPISGVKMELTTWGKFCAPRIPKVRSFRTSKELPGIKEKTTRDTKEKGPKSVHTHVKHAP